MNHRRYLPQLHKTLKNWKITRKLSQWSQNDNRLSSYPPVSQSWLAAQLVMTSGAKTIKKNTNSTQNKSQTHRAKQYEVTSFLSTDCELSIETCSKKVYSLGPWSRSPASPNSLPIVDSNLQIEWKFPIISFSVPYCSGCFHAISVTFAYSAWSKTTAMLSSCRADRIETDCHKISWTVGNSVAVGRYPIASDVHSLCSLVKMLNPVHELVVWSYVSCTRTNSDTHNFQPFMKVRLPTMSGSTGWNVTTVN